VDIVLLNWNGWRDTLRCLRSLQQLDYANHRVVLVDNGSTDDSVARIREASPAVTVIESPENLGFAAGCNVAIRHALARGAEMVWLLNNDSTVSPGTLSLMVDRMRTSQEVGIVGSVVRTAADPEVIEAWGGGWVHPRLGTTTRCTSPDGRPIDYIAGTSMLIRREVFEDVGLLDEDFYFYMEDAEFSPRAVRRGWRIEVAEGADVLHTGGAGINEGQARRSARADRCHVKSSGVFVGKHAGRWVSVAAPVRFAAVLVKRVLRREFGQIRAVSRAFWEGVALGLRRRGYPAPSAVSASSTKTFANSVKVGASRRVASHPRSFRAARSRASAMAGTDVAGNGSVTAP
jgi:GT2 family glycosyltransferase